MGNTRAVYQRFVRPFRWPILAILCLIFVQRLLSMGVTGLSGWLINFLILDIPFAQWVAIPLCMGGLWVLSHVVETTTVIANQRYADQPLWRSVMNAVMRHVSSLSTGQATMEHSAVTMSVIAEGRMAVQGIVRDSLEGVIPVVLQIIMVAGGFVVFLHPILALEMVVTVILFIGATVLLNLPMPEKVKYSQKEGRKDSKFRNEVLRNMAFVVGNGRQHEVIKTCDDSVAHVLTIERDMWTPYQLKLLVRDSLLSLARAGIVLTAGYLAYQKTIEVGSIVVVWSWLNMATGDLYITGGLYRRMITHVAAIDRFLKMFEVTNDTPEAEHPQKPALAQGEIVVTDVSFSYPPKQSHDDEPEDAQDDVDEDEDHTLQNISFRVPAGKRIAIVGKSGSGKTTIARLLMRAFDPHHGSVTIDKVDVRDLPSQWLREAIGVVDQRVGVFDHTLRYNLLCALSDNQRTEITEERIASVLRDCAVDEFLGDLPKGLDTILGEGGSRLSGGQSQRVALARIMLKDPLILILDEATSALDAETEEFIRANVDRARQGRTTIIIAHRFSTIRKADAVIVVDDGKIVDTGTHRELWIRCPAYQRLVQNQVMAIQDLVA